MDTGVAVLGAAVLVREWDARAMPAPERARKAGHPAPLVMTGGENDGSSG